MQGIPIAPTRACPLSQGTQSFGGASAGDGLMGAKAELDASCVFHRRFENVPEQGEVPKQITMQDTAHPSLPSCPQLVLGHLPCLRGREGRRARLPAGSSPTPPQAGFVCWLSALSPALTPCLAAAGVR